MPVFLPPTKYGNAASGADNLLAYTKGVVDGARQALSLMAAHRTGDVLAAVDLSGTATFGSVVFDSEPDEPELIMGSLPHEALLDLGLSNIDLEFEADDEATF